MNIKVLFGLKSMMPPTHAETISPRASQQHTLRILGSPLPHRLGPNF